MGRYLDLAANVIVGLDTDSQCEKSELSEISPPVSEGLHCEKSELSEKTPQGETWGAAAASTKIALLLARPVGLDDELPKHRDRIIVAAKGRGQPQRAAPTPVCFGHSNRPR